MLAILGPAVSDNAIVARPLADAARIATLNYSGAEESRSLCGFHFQIGSLEDEPAFLAAHLAARAGFTCIALIQDSSYIGRRMSEFFEDVCAVAGLSLIAADHDRCRRRRCTKRGGDRARASDPDVAHHTRPVEPPARRERSTAHD